MSSLQINPLTELLVELGVMVACPGKECLVKIGMRGRNAKDAGNFDAHKLQCRQLVGSVEKVGVVPDPKRVGPASQNLEYG